MFTWLKTKPVIVKDKDRGRTKKREVEVGFPAVVVKKHLILMIGQMFDSGIVSCCESAV